MSTTYKSAAERYAEEHITEILNDKHSDVKGVIFHSLVNAFNKGYDTGVADGITANDSVERGTL